MSSGREVSLGLVQMDCQPKAKTRNLDHALDLAADLRGQVQLICLPEFFTTGYHLDLIGDDFYQLAEPIPGETTTRVGEVARQWGVVFLGNIPEQDQHQAGVLYDTSFLIDSSGQLVGRYRKSHLYPTEHRYFRAGNELPVFRLELATGPVQVAIATCYDHAFPEIFRVLTLKGAELIIIPSLVPRGFEYLLTLRTRARAQDNQLFVAAVNRVGQEQNIQYCGLSMVVNPRGDVISQASDSEQVLTAELDLELILKERQQEPTLRSRRPELYGLLSDSRNK